MLVHGLAYLGSRIVNGALALGSLHLLTHWLSAADYGRYALALAVVNMATTVLFQWLNVASARFYPEYRTSPGPLWRASGQLFALMTATAFILAFTLVPAASHRNMDASLAPAIVLAVVAMGAHGLSIHIVNAMQRPLLYGVLTSSRAAAALCGSAGLIYLGWGTTGALVGFALGGWVALILFAVAVRPGLRSGDSEAPNPDAARNLRNSLLRYGVPLSMTYVATMIIDVSDRLMIGAIHGAEAVAAYSAAYDLVQQTMGAMMNVFFLAGFPALILALRDGETGRARHYHFQMGVGVLLTGTLLTALFAGASSDIARLMFGSALREDAAQVMPLVAAAIALAGFRSYFLDVAFQAAQRTDLQLKVTLAIAGANVLGNLLFIPLYGALGSAIAAVLAFALGAVLSWWAARGLTQFPRMGPTATAALLSSVSAWAILAMFDDNGGLLHVAGKLTLGVIAYAAVTLALDVAGIRTWLLRQLRNRFRRES